MEIKLNGMNQVIADGLTVREVLERFQFRTDSVAIAVNHQHIPRSRWEEVRLSAGDKIEVLSPQQGG